MVQPFTRQQLAILSQTISNTQGLDEQGQLLPINSGEVHQMETANRYAGLLLSSSRNHQAHSSFEIKLEVESRKIKVTTASREEMLAFLPTVQQFLAGQAVSHSTTLTQTILLFAANPKSTSQLRLDQEVRGIAEGLRLATRRDQFVFEVRWAARPRDLHRAMLEKKPRIVHLCGHCERSSLLSKNRKAVTDSEEVQSLEGVVLEDETGQAKLVDGASLASLFKLFADQVECVILNSCYSRTQAEAIAKYIPYVVGMNQAISDRAAIEFAIGFYDALGAGRSIEFAYELGCSAIQLAGIPEYLTPVLIRKGTQQSEKQF